MAVAIEQANLAIGHGDVPVGAVVVRDGTVISARRNERELTGDPTAHAEILAIRDAAAVVGHWRLDDCTLVVTLEPCAMCAGAMVNARIQRLVYGADDPKAGAAGSLMNLVADRRLNHRMPIISGVEADALRCPARRLLRRPPPLTFIAFPGHPTDCLRSCWRLARSLAPARIGTRRSAASLARRKDARADEWDGLESR